MFLLFISVIDGVVQITVDGGAGVLNILTTLAIYTKNTLIGRARAPESGIQGGSLKYYNGILSLVNKLFE